MTETNNIICYQTAMSIARTMMKKGIISSDEIVSIEDKLAQKYGLKFGDIYREIDLINTENRANICIKKEAVSCKDQLSHCQRNSNFRNSSE